MDHRESPSCALSFFPAHKLTLMVHSELRYGWSPQPSSFAFSPTSTSTFVQPPGEDASAVDTPGADAGEGGVSEIVAAILAGGS